MSSWLQALQQGKAPKAPAVTEQAPVDPFAEAQPAPAPEASVEAPTINPPDGVPHGVDYVPPAPPAKPGEEALGQEDYLAGGFQGMKLKSLKKPQLCELIPLLQEEVAVRALSLPQEAVLAGQTVAVGHVVKAPEEALSGFKRPALKAAAWGLYQALQGTEAPTAQQPLAPPEPVNNSLTPAEPAAEAPAQDIIEEVVAVESPSEDANHAPAQFAPQALHQPWLFIDCAHADAVPAVQWLEPVIEAAQKELKVPHYLAAEYRRGVDNIATRLAILLRDGVALPAAMYVDTRWPLAPVLLEALVPLYGDHVVRSIR